MREEFWITIAGIIFIIIFIWIMFGVSNWVNKQPSCPECDEQFNEYTGY